MGLWENVTGLFQRAASAAGGIVVVGDEDPIVEEQQLWRQFQRIGGNLTPQQVSHIILEADTGQIARFVDLSNEARQKDGHLHSVLQTRELALKGLRWSVAPPENASAAEKKAAADIEQQLKDSENFPDLVHHLSGAGPYHGHATAETIYARVGRFIVPERWNLIHPRRFVFAVGDGRLLWSDSGAQHDGVDLMEVYPGKFVQYQPIINGDVRVREGLARVLIWLALFRNWSLRDWLQLGEIGWKPWRIGKYSKDPTTPAGKLDIEILKRVVRRLGTTGSAVIPESTSLAVEWPKGTQASSTSSSHRELFDVMGAEMSKAVLGQTLTTEQGNRGSQSLGNVQDRVRGDILVGDAIGEAAALTRCVVRPLHALNAGGSVRPGHFIFHTEDAADLESFSKALKTFTEAGLRIPAAWVRNQSGIPTPKEGEEVLVGAKQAEGPAASKPAA